MSKRNYPRLPIEEFGRHLITSGDLDPVYIALPKAIDDEDQMFRWLVAYWCFYNCGAASWLSEKPGLAFWNAMAVAAENVQPAPTGPEDRWPRGHERRHFRGQAAMDAVQSLREKYGKHPEHMVYHMLGGKRLQMNLTFKYISDRAQEHKLFGPWIGFKIADMVERVIGLSVSFDEAAVFMFKDPMKAALMLWRQRAGVLDNAVIKDKAKAIHAVVAHLEAEFSDLSAPPNHNRVVGLQEVETVLCKWKSSMNGHYPLNNDIDEINAGVLPWVNHSNTAAAFMHFMPRRVE